MELTFIIPLIIAAALPFSYMWLLAHQEKNQRALMDVDIQFLQEDVSRLQKQVKDLAYAISVHNEHIRKFNLMIN